MGDKRKTESWVVRTPPGMKERLTKAAASQDIDRNKLVVRSLERTLGIQHEDDELPAEAHTCTHPRDKRRVFAYGTFCGAVLPSGAVCGVRIR